MEMDDRLKKEVGAGSARRSREMEDRGITQSRLVSDDERLELFRMQAFNNVLPTIPDIPGYHVCWLTTTNPSDPIHRRVQLGYEPVKPEEAPGMQYATLKTGEYQGLIGVNEMVAFKLPLSLYEKFMQEVHHRQPLAEEANLANQTDQMREQALRMGGKLQLEEGMEDLRSSHPMRGDFGLH
jgi:hypothetical protein